MGVSGYNDQPAINWRIGAAIIVACWIFYFLLTISLDAYTTPITGSFLLMLGVIIVVGITLSLPLVPLVHRLAYMSIGKRIGLTTLAAMPAAMVTTVLSLYLTFYVYQPQHLAAQIEKLKARDTYPYDVLLQGFSQHMFLFAVVAILLVAIAYALEARRAEQRASALEIEAREAQLRALLYQVNPHFLFNTLNSLSSLVMAGKNVMAERMILNLSAFLRSTLHANPLNDIRLSDEIALQNLYLDIEQTRFPNRLQFNTDVPQELEDACIPVLILQPIIENAIKYGVAPTTQRCAIDVTAREGDGRLSIEIKNDFPPVAAPSGSGMGLANVSHRLAAHYGAAASIHWGRSADDAFVVSMSMPLIRDGK